jgi:hypothetical protein
MLCETTKRERVELTDLPAGAVIRLDTGRCEPVKRCDDWDRATHRFPNPIPQWRWAHAIACRITSTGRQLHRYNGALWVRVRVTWVGDCEPDTSSGAWLLVDSLGNAVIPENPAW